MADELAAFLKNVGPEWDGKAQAVLDSIGVHSLGDMLELVDSFDDLVDLKEMPGIKHLWVKRLFFAIKVEKRVHKFTDPSDTLTLDSPEEDGECAITGAGTAPAKGKGYGKKGAGASNAVKGDGNKGSKGCGYPVAQQGAVAASEELDIELCWLSGESLGSVRIESLALGRELVAKVRDLIRPARGIVSLLSGAEAVVEELPLGQQGLHGSRDSLLVVVSPVTEQQESEVVETILRRIGRRQKGGEAVDDLTGNEWQVWEGVKSITFGQDFNQSMENVTLPSGLQSITFGSYFNQSMENVTLPSGLQSITSINLCNSYTLLRGDGRPFAV